MANKSSKFRITAPAINDDGRDFIIHMRNPVIIAEVFYFNEDQEREWEAAKSQFTMGASVDYPGELIFLGAIFCAPFDLGDPQKTANKLAGIMSRMGDWYHAHLKLEDESL